MLLKKAIYLPMVIIVLNQDLKIINNSQIKLKTPYIEWIEKNNYYCPKRIIRC